MLFELSCYLNTQLWCLPL